MAGTIGANSLYVKAKILGMYCGRYLAPVVNGIYIGYNVQVPLDGDLEFSMPLTPGTQVGSIYFEDAGDWPSFPSDYDVTGWAQSWDATTAQRILFTWSAGYSLVPVQGDAQLSGLTITGAKRGLNVGPSNAPTRGSLSYSITTVSGTHIIRFWADSKIVAEGTISGNGAFQCSQLNGSGLTITGNLSYSADLQPGIATVELRWSEAFQVHYDINPLSFPRSPQLTVTDRGYDSFLYLSPVLGGAVYYYNVLTVDDCGNVQSSGFPTTSPVQVNVVPGSPTITSVTGNASSLTVNWLKSATPNCEYNVYSSLINYAVNFGSYPIPAPILTAYNATSATLAPITGYASVDRSGFVTALEASFDSAVATCNAAFASGQTGFATAFNTLLQSVMNAMKTYGQNCNLYLWSYIDAVNASSLNTSGLVNALASVGLSASDWSNQVGQPYADFLAFLGALLNGNSGRYSLPNGAIGQGAAGSSTLGTGSAPDGSAGVATPVVGTSLADLCAPVVLRGKMGIIVRARNMAGVQEQADQQFTVEFDDSGNIVNPRPNVAQIQTWNVTNGLTLNVTASYLDDDSAQSATAVDLYVVPAGTGIDPTAPVNSATLPALVFNGATATLTYTVGVSGEYTVAVAGKAADGTRSALSPEYNIYLTNTPPAAVIGLTASVIRGKPAAIS